MPEGWSWGSSLLEEAGRLSPVEVVQVALHHLDDALDLGIVGLEGLVICMDSLFKFSMGHGKPVLVDRVCQVHVLRRLVDSLNELLAAKLFGLDG